MHTHATHMHIIENRYRQGSEVRKAKKNSIFTRDYLLSSRRYFQLSIFFLDLSQTIWCPSYNPSHFGFQIVLLVNRFTSHGQYGRSKIEMVFGACECIVAVVKWVQSCPRTTAAWRYSLECVTHVHRMENANGQSWNVTSIWGWGDSFDFTQE